jgi:hypothetical protein
VLSSYGFVGDVLDCLLCFSVIFGARDKLCALEIEAFCFSFKSKFMSSVYRVLFCNVMIDALACV